MVPRPLLAASVCLAAGLGSCCLQVVSDEAGGGYAVPTSPNGGLNIPQCTLATSSSPGVTTLYSGVVQPEHGGSDEPRETPGFYTPLGVALGSDCSVYLTDMLGTVWKVDPQGNGTQLTSQVITSASDFAVGLGMASSGTLYVADPGGNGVYDIDSSGSLAILAGGINHAGPGTGGFADGTGGANGSAKFNGPVGVAVDSSGTVYVGDTDNNRVRKIDTLGNVTTLAGNGQGGREDGTGGPGGTAEFLEPTGVAVDASGNVYVADTGNGRICKIDTSGNVTTVAGAGVNGPRAPINQQGGYADGTGGSNGTAKFLAPSALAIASDGTIYVADTGNNRVRKIDTAGNVTTLAGNGVESLGGAPWVPMEPPSSTRPMESRSTARATSTYPTAATIASA